ncbi:hypothetical protein M440DRAFT_1040024 [Trichoderma longibrachiatum ATCC 18648]|uniref:Uncharacterized protein n=1 Tax=Trichoderma longibrachiatum ATCC 18648 TaxID=983965 RepID=A0A2T4BXT0_TRILO|nr:hypothetical protein M440DRAFT_1040024 [Trichoderma longibrachiatum ATCC 18648]
MIWDDDSAFGSKATRGRAVKMTTSTELDGTCEVSVASRTRGGIARSSDGQGHSRAAGADQGGPPAPGWLRRGRRRGQLSRGLPKSADIAAGRPQRRDGAQVAVHRCLLSVRHSCQGVRSGTNPSTRTSIICKFRENPSHIRQWGA